MKLFVNSALNNTLKAELQQQLPADQITVIFRHDLPADQQQTEFQSADVVMGNPPANWFAGPLPNLKFWQLDSAGFDGYKEVQVQAAIANMGDYFAWPCAETMMAGLLAMYRRIPELAILQSRSEWVGAPIRDRMDSLRHKHVVILGTGTIGQAMRQMLTGFSCEVKMLARTDLHADLHTAGELEEVLPQTDILINCLPGTAVGFVSASVIAAMKPGSIYANVGRGTTTDEPALISALQAGKLAGAVLDVTAIEPLPTDSLLWTLPTVLLTQHTGGGQLNEEGGKVKQFLENLNRFLAGEPLRNTVELSRGY